jgi:hypothetical protein
MRTGSNPFHDSTFLLTGGSTAIGAADLLRENRHLDQPKRVRCGAHAGADRTTYIHAATDEKGIGVCYKGFSCRRRQQLPAIQPQRVGQLGLSPSMKYATRFAGLSTQGAVSE